MSQIIYSSKLKMLIILIGLAILIAGSFVLAKYQSLKIIRDSIEKISSGDSQNKYKVNDFSINLDLFNRKIIVNHLKLIPEFKDSLSNQFELHLPSFEIEIESFSDLLFHKELKIESIKIITPNIILNRNLSTTRNDISFETGELYQILSAYLSLFKVKDLNLNHGIINYNRNINKKQFELDINQVNLIVKNFLIDSLKDNTNKLINTESILLEIKDQIIYLSDSIHQVSFDKLTLSTSDSSIVFEQMKILPTVQFQMQRQDLNDSYNLYFLIIPRFELRGIDFQKAYQANNLSIEDILIQSPRIHIESIEKNLEFIKSSSPSNSLGKLITDIFYEIDVSNLNISNAKFDLMNVIDESKIGYSIDNVDIQIEEFEIDSSSYQISRKYKYVKDFTIEIRNYDKNTDDSLYQIGFSKLLLSTKDSLVIVDSLRLSPTQFSNKKVNYVDLFIPHSELSGSRLIDSWMSKKLLLDNIYFDRPQLKLELNNSNEEDSNEELLKYKGLFQEINLNNLSINQGNFFFKSAESELSIEDYDLHAHNLILVDNEFKAFLRDSLIADLVLTARNAHLENVTGNGKFSKLYFDLRKGDLNAADLSINLKINNFENVTSFRNLDLKGLDFLKFRQHKILSFDSLKIAESQLNIPFDLLKNSNESNEMQFNSWLKKMTFQKVEAMKSNINIYTEDKSLAYVENISLIMSDYIFDSSKNEYFIDVTFNLDKIGIQLQEINHVLEIGQLTLTESSDLEIASFNLKSKDLHQLNQFIINGNKIQFSQIDLHQFINENKIHFEKGTTKNTNIHIAINSNAQDKNILNFNILNSILDFDTFELKNAEISYFNNASIQLKEFSTKDLSLIIDHFNQPSPSDSIDIFNAANILLNLDSVSLNSDLLINKINIGSIQIETFEGSLSITDLSYSDPEKQNILIDEIQFRNLNYKSLIEETKINVKDILVSNPNIFINMDHYNASFNKESSNFKFHPEIEIENIKLEEANVKILSEHFNLGDTIRFNDLNLNIFSLSIDSTTEFSNWDYSNTNLTFDAGPFYLKLNDSLSYVHFDKLTYRQSDFETYLFGFEYGQKYDPATYTDYITFQSTWLRSKSDTFSIVGFDPISAIREENIFIDTINIINLSIDTKRDKRVVFNPDQQRYLPQFYMISSPFIFKINHINILNTSVNYSEIPEDGFEPGHLYFNNVNASLNNVTNQIDTVARDDIMTLNANGLIMKNGRFQLETIFNLSDSLYNYQMNGRIGNLDLKEFNEFMEKSAYVQIKSGTNKIIDFDFTADKYAAIGEMIFYYKDLKLNILKHKADQSDIKNKAFLTFFANAFVVSKKNPKFLISRKGDIFIQNDTQRAIFNYWAKALLSGVVSSVGAKNNKKEIRKFFKLRRDKDHI